MKKNIYKFPFRFPFIFIFSFHVFFLKKKLAFSVFVGDDYCNFLIKTKTLPTPLNNSPNYAYFIHSSISTEREDNKLNYKLASLMAISAPISVSGDPFVSISKALALSLPFNSCIELHGATFRASRVFNNNIVFCDSSPRCPFSSGLVNSLIILNTDVTDL